MQSNYFNEVSRIEKKKYPTDKDLMVLDMYVDVTFNDMLERNINAYEQGKGGKIVDPKTGIKSDLITIVYEFFGVNSVDECKQKLKELRKQHEEITEQVKARVEANKQFTVKNLTDMEDFLSNIEKSIINEPAHRVAANLAIIKDSIDLLDFRVRRYELERYGIPIVKDSLIYPGDISSVYKFFNTDDIDVCKDMIEELKNRHATAKKCFEDSHADFSDSDSDYNKTIPQTFNNYSDFERYLSRIEKAIEPTEKAEAILIAMGEVLRILKIEIKRHKLEQSGIKLDEDIRLMFGDISDVFEFFGNDSVDECKRKLKALRKRQKLALKQVKAYLKANK